MAGLAVVMVCGVLVANRLVVSTDVAVFRRINQWPGWLYPPMWTVQLPGVIGALPLVAAAALGQGRLALDRRRRGPLAGLSGRSPMAESPAAPAGVAVWRQDVLLAERQRLAGGHPELPFDKVEAGHCFGHRVFDL